MQLEKQGLENVIKNLHKEISILEEKLLVKETELESIKESEDKNVGDMKSEMNDYLLMMKERDNQIKENKAEINNLTNQINSLGEKLRVMNMEKDGHIQNLFDSERKLKDNIIMYKQKMEEKENFIQSILDEKEKLKFDNEKLKSEIKSFEKNKSYDEELINQISLIQSRAAEKERKITEEKDSEIRQLKKDIDNLTLQVKKSNSDKENSKTTSENLFLKSEVENLRQENKEIKEYREKMMKLERSIIDLQNNLAIKKVEISQSESDKEKLISENRRMCIEVNDQKSKIENLEKDLIYTKQKLGDVLNELSEMENHNTTPTPRNTDKSMDSVDKKKSGFSSFFSKKKKDN